MSDCGPNCYDATIRVHAAGCHAVSDTAAATIVGGTVVPGAEMSVTVTPSSGCPCSSCCGNPDCSGCHRTAAKAKEASFDYGEKRSDGQYTRYPVLPEEDRAQGFGRPVRRAYVHEGVPGSTHKQHVDGQLGKPTPEGTGCGVVTYMGQSLAETYARDPSYYGSTYCAGCKGHYPVAEFVWDGTQERVGS